MHGWCAEKENGGKGGSGQGKIWAKVGFLPIHGSSWDPVGTQLGTNFALFWHRFWPVGIQSGSSRAPMSKGSQIHKTQHFCRVLARFWMILAASRQVQTWCQKLENWCPTGSRLAKSGAKKCKNWCPTASNWIPSGSRLVFLKKRFPRSYFQNLSTFF